MDTNSIQPVGNSELREANPSGEISFADSYLRTTNALGVWPIATAFSVLAVGALTILMGPFFVFALNTVLSSYVITLVCWLGLSWFRWPITLKAVLSVWAAIFAGLIPLLLTVMKAEPVYNVTAYSVMAFSLFVFVTMVIPPFAISVVTLLPYVIAELLLKDKSIPGVGKICQNKKNGEEQE